MQSSHQTREERAARNQSMFRAINNRLTLGDPLADITGTHVIACECADPSCVATIVISREAYEEVRHAPTHFIVLPGHVLTDIERIIADLGEYVVVEKIDAAAKKAEELEHAPFMETRLADM